MSYPQQAGYAPPPHQATVIVPQPVRATYGGNNDPRWRTCCCHVYTCTIIIAVLEGLSLASQLLGLVTAGKKDSASIASSVSSLFIGGIVLALLAFGLWQKRAPFIIPHLVLQAISVVAFIVLAIVVMVAAIVMGAIAFVNAAKGDEKKSETDYDGSRRDDSEDMTRGVAIAAVVILILMFLLAAAMQIWWFVVVLKCYRWLREGAFSGPGAGAYATYTTTTTTPGYPQQGAPLLHQNPDTKQYA